VACGFWKEKPGLREALDSLTKPEVFIVPNFTVEGYFVRNVIPKELGLTGPVTRRENGQVLRTRTVPMNIKFGDNHGRA
jgi:sirohydrochlorin cobaltochelatase